MQAEVSDAAGEGAPAAHHDARQPNRGQYQRLRRQQQAQAHDGSQSHRGRKRRIEERLGDCYYGSSYKDDPNSACDGVGIHEVSPSRV